MGGFAKGKHWNYFLIIIALGLQLYSTHCAPGITYDSRQYLSSAQSFATNQQLLNEEGKPHLAHTPLYAITLSFLGKNRLQLSKYVNTICLAITLLLWLYLGNQVLTRDVYQWLFAIVLALATPLQLVHHFVWSEPMFVMLLSASVVLLYKYSKKNHPKYLLALALLGFFLCLQRNPGIFLVAGFALGLWWFLGVKWWKVFAYTLIATLGWLFWTFYTFTANPKGTQPAFHNVLEELLSRHNLDHHLNVLSSWFLPISIPLMPRALLFSILLIFVLVAVLYWQIKPGKFTKVLLTLVFVYIICLQFTERVDYHETTRYLAVIFPLIFLALFQLLELINEHLPMIIARTFKLIVLLWLLYPIGRTWKNVGSWHKIRCATMTPNIQANYQNLIYLDSKK